MTWRKPLNDTAYKLTSRVEESRAVLIERFGANQGAMKGGSVNIALKIVGEGAAPYFQD